MKKVKNMNYNEIIKEMHVLRDKSNVNFDDLKRYRDLNFRYSTFGTEKVLLSLHRRGHLKSNPNILFILIENRKTLFWLENGKIKEEWFNPICKENSITEEA